MAISIHTNLMAGNAARTLGSHYNRLSKSVQRLSSGLRINSAADDAAGLAIRELMRADVSTLNQGIRNANDAISMIQTADGALAVIDEKLIRMKELAEQAATGTYNSTQRLIIHSEYVAMANEIDRIAMATDFNGIHLLDGSLSGVHNGGGLNSTGSMKIHFGAGNDSAEDYYYISIGDCTIKGLGLGTGASETTRLETLTETAYTFHPKPSYIEYTDPDTGNKYYTDGDFYFSDTDDPAGTRLDWETDGNLIKKLKMVQKTVSSSISYQTYLDPDTGKEYYLRNKVYTPDPYDPQGTLDPNNAADKVILDRLQKTTKGLQVNMIWKVYKDPDGNSYYSYNNGQTFVPDVKEPSTGVLDSKNNADKQIIKTFTPEMSEKRVVNTFRVEFTEYVDAQTSRSYWSSDGGKTFVGAYQRPDETKLDPVIDKDIIARLQAKPQTASIDQIFPQWYDEVTKEIYYTLDYGKTFFTDILHPENIIFSADNPAHAAAVAKLKPNFRVRDGYITCTVYEDSTDNNKKYYSMDNGKTYFDDLGDYIGSAIDASDPNYAALQANLKKVDSTVSITVQYNMYHSLNSGTNIFYSSDDGKTFVTNADKPAETTLDPNHPYEGRLIAGMVPYCYDSRISEEYFLYKNPAGVQFYTTDGIIFRNYSGSLILDRNNPADLQIIDTFQMATNKVSTTFLESLPETYYIYEDKRSGTIYYSPDDGKTFTTQPSHPSDTSAFLDPTDPADLNVLNNLEAVTAKLLKVEYINQGAGGGAAISTQQAAQEALVAIDRAIVSKDKIRAHLGALQNRLENTVTNLSIQAENLQASESRISDTDVATEMTAFVRNQILTESATAMLSQANSFPHMLMNLLQG